MALPTLYLSDISEVRAQAPLASRFWRKIDKNGPIPAHCAALGPCWLWTGSTYSNGYGNIQLRIVGEAKSHRALTHRVSYLLNYSYLPAGLEVCHACDVRNCCNPAHLFLGTRKDNADDSVRKGRNRYGYKVGDEHACSRITSAQVLDIRRRAFAGEEYRDIAAAHGIAHAHAYEVAWHRIWKSVGGPYPDGRGVAKGERCHFARLAAHDVRTIRAAVADGVSCGDLARLYGVTPSNISAIARRISWKHIV